MKKFERDISKLAKKYGRKLRRKKNGHYCMYDPKGKKGDVSCASSPSDRRRFIKNVERDLKHYN